MRSDIGLSAKQGTVIRENPTHLATYNPAGGGFHQLVENRPDLDAGAGYPSIPSRSQRSHCGRHFLVCHRNAWTYFNETYQRYSLLCPHDTGDFEVIGLHVHSEP